mgnify:CR=1 FL=1
MLVGTFKIQVGRERHAFTLAEYAGVGHAGIKPDIECVAGFLITVSLITEQFRGFEFDGSPLQGFDQTVGVTAYGGRLGLGDVTYDGDENLLAGLGPDLTADSTVYAFSYDGVTLI